MMQAIVLAGGLGTRLKCVVPDLPRPMAPVAGRPFLAWILDRLVEAGFERAVLAVGYKHEVLRNHFGASYRGLPLHYSVESTPLGTGGAMRLAAGYVTTDPIFILNGDTYLELDFRAMLAAHLQSRASLSVAVCKVTDVSRYGALDLDNGIIRGFMEKGGAGSGWINAGNYLISAELLESIPVGSVFSFEQELLVPQTQTIRPAAFLTDGLFIDIGVPEDYDRAQRLFNHV
jgi:D-glycero-alpha-D-manno-heptose 1-phosphate guanylyltransferase